MEQKDTTETQRRFGVNTQIKFESSTVTGAPNVSQSGRTFLPVAEVDPARVAKVLMHFTGLVNVILGSILDTAESYMVEADYTVRQEKLFKGEVKFRLKIAHEKFGKLKKCLYENVKGREDLYMTLLDIIQEDIDKDLKLLYYPILRILDKHKVEKSHMMAQIEVAWFALYLACKLYEAIVNGSSHLSATNTKGFFSTVDPRDTFGAWEKFCNTIQTYDTETSKEISTDKDINMAFDILLNKLCDADYVDRHCQQALDAHPEFDERAQEIRAKLQEDTIKNAAEGVLQRRSFTPTMPTKKFKIYK